MIGDKLRGSLNDQINEEFQSAYLYLAMSANCESQNLPGFANWFKMQAEEELRHGMRFFQFILDREGHVALQGITAPPEEFGSLAALLEDALNHERQVTRSIHDLYRLAEEEKDYPAYALLEEFATEQVEEEKSVTYILESLKRVGEDGTGLFILDKELAGRGAAAGAGG
ncbi:MAG: ferritin [Actinomycetota bacterium]